MPFLGHFINLSGSSCLSYDVIPYEVAIAHSSGCFMSALTYLRACSHAFVRACIRAWLRACVRQCVCACV